MGAALKFLEAQKEGDIVLQRVLRYWQAILAVVAAAVIAVVWGTETLAHNVAVASTHVGPTQFVEYAMNNGNNAVYETPSAAHWATKWTFKAPVPIQQASVANGVVYASSDGGIFPGQSVHGYIYALGAKTGRLLWRQTLNNMSMTTPVVGDGLVFVGSGSGGFTAANFAKEDNLNARHIIRGVGLSGVYALNQKTGQVVWEYLTRGEDMPTFVLKGNTLLVANGDGKVYSFDARTGKKEWTVSIDSYVSMSSPTYANGVLYVSGAHPYDLYAIDVATHKILWKAPIPGVFAGSDDCSLAFANNHVYVLGTIGSWAKPSSVAFAFTTGGALAWQTNLGQGTLPLNIEAAAPVAVGSTVYFGSMVTNTEYALNAATGAVKWSFHASGPISEAPALLANRLYFGDSKGTFYVLKASSGHMIASKTMSGSMFAADYPVIVGQTLYQPDDNGEIFARPLNQVK